MSFDTGGKRLRYQDRNQTFLEKHLVSKEPIGQFKAWFDEACSKKEILEPNAMCLATATEQGVPSARFVLCKEYSKDGFKFFTNYESRKALEMERAYWCLPDTNRRTFPDSVLLACYRSILRTDNNPNVAATFYWESLYRSIRIEGYVDKLSEEESTIYFHSRPIPSQITASASHQSMPIASRDVLLEREAALEQTYLIPELQVPKPTYWGGYIIRPRAIEFWQGQDDRLHDRIRFRRPKEREVPDNKLLHKGVDGWVYERLSP